MSEQFFLRADPRARLEIELLTPMLAVASAATVILFTIANYVPGQFAGRGFEIPPLAAAAASLVLLVSLGLKLRPPERYEINETGLDIVMPFATYRIPFTQMSKVVSMSERRPVSSPLVMLQQLVRHTVDGYRTIFARLKTMSGPSALPMVRGDYTTCDTGGVLIECLDGQSALLSPAELSQFLRDLERGLLTANPSVQVIREIQVKIG